MFKVTNDDIEGLIKKEYDGAMEKGLFASWHEFAAVLREEIEEASVELTNLEYAKDNLWEDIKDDKTSFTILEDINQVKENATNCIKELLQVCAVCNKRLYNGFKTTNRDTCFHCGGQLCWDNDFDFEDLDVYMEDDEGNELDGIVHILHCNNCGADIEYHVPSGIKEKENINNTRLNFEYIKQNAGDRPISSDK